MSRQQPQTYAAAPRMPATDEALLRLVLVMARDITAELRDLCAMLALLHETRAPGESRNLVPRLLPLIAARVETRRARLGGLVDVLVGMQRRPRQGGSTSHRHPR